MRHDFGDFGAFSLSVVVTPPPWYENCYIVRHRESGAMVIVDPGGDAPGIQAAIDDLKGVPAAIWLTHGHPDHLGAARALEDRYGIGTLAHIDEQATIARAGDLNRSFTGEGQDGPVRLSFLETGKDLDLGGILVRAIHTPGHTPGGICFDFGGFALTGDTLFRHGVGRTDLPGGDEAQLWASIPRLLGQVEDDTTLFSGHGPDWTVAEARRWWTMMA